MAMRFFCFPPSIPMPGFMFPFRGMPDWARMPGETTRLTHFPRVVRGALLKGNAMADVWPILAFPAAVSVPALARYREALDRRATTWSEFW